MNDCLMLCVENSTPIDLTVMILFIQAPSLLWCLSTPLLPCLFLVFYESQIEVVQTR